MVLDIPAPNLIDLLSRLGLDVVGHDLHLERLLLADEVSQQSLDNRPHPTAEHHDGHIIGPAPRIKLFEFRVQLDIVQQEPHALVERQVHAVHHLAESVAKGPRARERVLVALDAPLAAEPDIVRHEVVRVLQRDGAVKVGEEYCLGGGAQGRERRPGCVLGGHCAGGGGDVFVVWWWWWLSIMMLVKRTTFVDNTLYDDV